MRPTIVTLTTDFGLQDTYVGVMKGVLLGIAPAVQIIDLTHEIAPQNIVEGAARLESAIGYFPAGTVHLAVVDPGVGSERAAIILETESYGFIGPDNGLFTLVLRRFPPRRVVEITEAARPYRLPALSHTFHGRDLFAPLAAHLAMGVEATAFGVERDPQTLVTLDLPEPFMERDTAGYSVLRATILYADRFGNLITNLTPMIFQAWRQARTDSEVRVLAGKARWRGIVRTYTEVSEGEPLAYWGSGGSLEIGVRNGDAARQLSLVPGDTITFLL